MIRCVVRLSCAFSYKVQGYLTYKRPPRTLSYAYALGPRRVLGGWAFSYGRGTPAQGARGYTEPDFPDIRARDVTTRSLLSGVPRS